MHFPISKLRELKIELGSGELVTPFDVSADSENGKILELRCAQGFLPVESLVPEENSWRFTGKIEKTERGENWKKFRVENRKGVKCGRISEIWIDVPAFYIVQFECTRKFLWFFIRKKIFSANDIFEVIPERRLIIIEEENRVFRKASAPLENFAALPGTNPSSCS